MRFAYLLSSNSTPWAMKYQVGESIADVGVPIIPGGSGEEGVTKATTTAAANCLGCNEDTATIVTTQQTDNSDPERTVSVIVDPNAVWEATLSGGATSGTALTLYEENTGNTDGLIVTTGADFSNFDEGAIWGFDGNNPGIARKIITGDATNADVGIPFPNDIAIGDNFLIAPFWPSEVQYVQLTSDLTQVDASAAVDTNNNNFIPIDAKFRGQGDDGRTKSAVLLVAADHMFGHGG